MGKGFFQLPLHGAQALPLSLEPGEVGPVVLGEEEDAAHRPSLYPCFLFPSAHHG